MTHDGGNTLPFGFFFRLHRRCALAETLRTQSFCVWAQRAEGAHARFDQGITALVRFSVVVCGGSVVARRGGKGVPRIDALFRATLGSIIWGRDGERVPTTSHCGPFLPSAISSTAFGQTHASETYIITPPPDHQGTDTHTHNKLSISPTFDGTPCSVDSLSVAADALRSRESVPERAGAVHLRVAESRRLLPIILILRRDCRRLACRLRCA
jgi:hypothetical protein